MFVPINCQSQTQLSIWMRQYPSLGIQTGRMTTDIEYAGTLAQGLRPILIVIAITLLLGFPALVIAINAPRWIPLSDISIGVCPMAAGAGVLIIAPAAAAALGPATGDLTMVATLPLECLELLWVLMPDLVPFAIVCIVCCAD